MSRPSLAQTSFRLHLADEALRGLGAARLHFFSRLFVFAKSAGSSFPTYCGLLRDSLFSGVPGVYLAGRDRRSGLTPHLPLSLCLLKSFTILPQTSQTGIRELHRHQSAIGVCFVARARGCEMPYNAADSFMVQWNHHSRPIEGGLGIT